MEWKQFIGSTNMRHSAQLSNVTADSWMDELRELQALTEEAQTFILCRDRMLANNENAQEPTISARKHLHFVTQRLMQLSEILNSPKSEISDGELIRRQDLLHNIRLERDRMQKSLLDRSPGQKSDRNRLLSIDSSTQLSSPSLNSPRGRVLGVPEETPETRGQDNTQILALHEQVVEHQDSSLDQLMAVIGRQKEIGRAIGDELDVQNQLLRDIDVKVGNTTARIKNAQKQADKLA